MKLNKLILIAVILMSTESFAFPRYEFSNGRQQLELKNSVYTLINSLQTKDCKIFVDVHSENDDAILMTLERHIRIELTVSSRKQRKTLTYSELNLHNWSKFEYQTKQIVLELC